MFAIDRCRCTGSAELMTYMLRSPPGHEHTPAALYTIRVESADSYGSRLADFLLYWLEAVAMLLSVAVLPAHRTVQT